MEKSIERYFSECSEKRIAPFSQIELRDFHLTGIFEPYIYAGRLIQIPGQFQKYMKEAVASLISGGKIHRISVDIRAGDDGKRGFEEFRNSLFNVLINQEYQINQGYLNLKPTRYGMDTGLDFRVTGRGLELRIGNEASEEDKEKLINWFNQLKKKYQSE